MNDYSTVLIVLCLLAAVGFATLDVQCDRRQIERFLRVGGARILKFRWKPFLGWKGENSNSKHYEVVFQEHTGRVLRAIFTYTAGIGVMQTSAVVLRDPGAAEDGSEDSTDSHRVE